MKYGIIGSGSANTAVVHEGLIDLRAKDPEAVFHIHARRSPQGAVGDVYDYLIDNEASFVSHTRIDDNAPKILLDSAIDVIKTDDPLMSILKSSDQVLILWDETNNEASEKMAITACDMGIPVLDLTMALTPVVIEGEAPAVTTTVVEEPTEEALAPFSREELESMTINVLRRQAKSMGVENPRLTKADIINQILGEEVEEDVKTKTTNFSTTDLDAMIVWVDQRGIIHTEKVDINALVDAGLLKAPPSTS